MDVSMDLLLCKESSPTIRGVSAPARFIQELDSLAISNPGNRTESAGGDWLAGDGFMVKLIEMGYLQVGRECLFHNCNSGVK